MDCPFVMIPRHFMEGEMWCMEDGQEFNPFDDGKALVDLHYLAAYKDHTIFVDFVGDREIKRGCVYRTMRQLGKRWGWSKNKVSAFLNKLEKQRLILQKRDNRIEKGGTLIVCLNIVDRKDLEYYSDFFGENEISKKGQTRDTLGTDSGHARDAEGPNSIKNKEELKTIAPVGATADAQKVSSAEYKEIAAHLADNVGLDDSQLKMAVHLLYKPADQWTPLSLGSLYYAIDQHSREGKPLSEDTIRLALGHMKGNTPSRQDFEDNYFKRAETQLKNIRIRLEQSE